MGRETTNILARTYSSYEIARQRKVFEGLLADEETDKEERTSLNEAIETLDEAARLQDK